MISVKDINEKVLKECQEKCYLISKWNIVENLAWISYIFYLIIEKPFPSSCSNPVPSTFSNPVPSLFRKFCTQFIVKILFCSFHYTDSKIYATPFGHLELPLAYIFLAPHCTPIVHLSHWSLISLVFIACGGAFNGISGTFASPNYPSNYNNRHNCQWTIVGPPGHRIRLTFTAFLLERCCDYVTIR